MRYSRAPSYVSRLAAAGLALLTACQELPKAKTLEARAGEPDTYLSYKQIDMDQLSQAESAYLGQMHQKYGKGPIDPTNLKDTLSPEMIEFFQNLTGNKRFTDRDLILINRSLDDIAGAIKSTMQ